MPRRTLRRVFRRAALALARPKVDLVASSDYAAHLPGRLHDPFRCARILSALREEGLLDPRRVHRPAPASIWQLRRVHADEYLEGLEHPGALERAMGTRLSDRAEQRLLEVQRAMVGGTLLATRMALASGGMAVSLAGGLHHARRARGAGFCLYNDVAVAISTLRHERQDFPIAVIDLDLHDGDGTRSIFAEDESVHTYSLHSRHWEEPRGIETTAIALGSGFGDEALLGVLHGTLAPLLDRFRPRLAFYLAGADPALDDALGDGRMTADGLLERDLYVARELARRRIPVVVLLAGGYGDDSWRYPARFLATRLAGRRVEPPTTASLLVSRFRDVAVTLSREALGGAAPDQEAPLFTAEDLVGALGGAAPESRFLGFYTLAGVELALERLGYLERMRALGFERPTIELDLTNPSGHTLRIFGGPDRAELLLETRLRRDRGTLPGFDFLRVEWLLLQNPRARFSADRPALPGQQYPGLGMLAETVAVLVLVCDRLKLDGLIVVASRYSTAAFAQREMRALDPEDDGRLRALFALLAGMTLAEASRAAEGGLVRDEATGEPLVWRPVTMTYPISDRLRERFAGAEWEARAEAARAGASYRLVAPGSGPSSRKNGSSPTVSSQ